MWLSSGNGSWQHVVKCTHSLSYLIVPAHLISTGYSAMVWLLTWIYISGQYNYRPFIRFQEFYKLFLPLKGVDKQPMTHHTSMSYCWGIPGHFQDFNAKLKVSDIWCSCFLISDTNLWQMIWVPFHGLKLNGPYFPHFLQGTTETMTTHCAQLLMATGFTEVKPELELLEMTRIFWVWNIGSWKKTKNFDTDIPETSVQFSLWLVSNMPHMNKHLLHCMTHGTKFICQLMPDPEWASNLSIYLDNLVEIFIEHVHDRGGNIQFRTVIRTWTHQNLTMVHVREEPNWWSSYRFGIASDYENPFELVQTWMNL